jgi:DNA polymerase-3 subunit beta
VKLECTRKEFAEALGLAASASSNRTALPILQTIKLEASGTTVRLLGCDGDMWAERTILANVEAEGAVCIQTRVLQQLVGMMPDGPLRLSQEGTSVRMTSAGSDYKLMALPADDFPEPPEISGASELTLTMSQFRESVDSVAFAVADDNSRPVLTGVLFSYDGSVLTLVATDYHRLAVRRIEQNGIGSNVSAIVPEKALKAIKALPIADGESVTVQFDENRLGVDAGSAKVVSQLLNGAFPNWERVVPGEHTRTWTVQRDEMIENISRALVLASDNANRVKFAGHGDQVVISARSEEKGEAKEEVAIIGQNGDIEIAFNGRYIVDALKAMKGDGIRAEMTESIRPAVFRPVDEDIDQFCVIMPMALN